MRVDVDSALINNQLVTGVIIESDGDVITALSYDATSVALTKKSKTILPTATDIHCHGGGGFYFSDPNPENIEKAISAHKSNGTARLIASLVTAPIPVLISQIKNLLPFINAGQILGIHLEGPYLSEIRCGAHDSKLLKDPTVAELSSLIEAAENNISMVTIAPERSGAMEAIKFLANNHILAAIGHSDASAEVAKNAIESGAKVFTHFYNGSPKFTDWENLTPRSLLNEGLTNPKIYLEFINDGIHLSREVTENLMQYAKDRMVLITDAMAAAGASDGEYFIGELPVEVKAGKATLKSNGSLAGSTLTTLVAAELLLQLPGVDLLTIDKYWNLNPSNLLGILPIQPQVGEKLENFLIYNHETGRFTKI